MIDFEDIAKAIFAHLREKVDELDTITRLNYYIASINEVKGDSLLEEVPDEDERYVLDQRCREMRTMNNWIDLALEENIEINSNFDIVAKNYLIQLTSIIRDNAASNDTFYKSVRMAEVLKNVMLDFFKKNRTFGITDGVITGMISPERVLVDGNKAIRSGITYLINII